MATALSSRLATFNSQQHAKLRARRCVFSRPQAHGPPRLRAESSAGEMAGSLPPATPSSLLSLPQHLLTFPPWSLFAPMQP